MRNVDRIILGRGKVELLGENPVKMPLCYTDIPREPAWDRTRAFAIRIRRL
jgi:hypothetical protein